MINKKEYLKAKKMVKKFESQPLVPPKFVRLINTAMRLVGKTYYRDGGIWDVEYRIIDGVLLSWYPSKPWLHKKPFIEITEEEWRIDNGQYAPDKV